MKAPPHGVKPAWFDAAARELARRSMLVTARAPWSTVSIDGRLLPMAELLKRANRSRRDRGADPITGGAA